MTNQEEMKNENLEAETVDADNADNTETNEVETAEETVEENVSENEIDDSAESENIAEDAEDVSEETEESDENSDKADEKTEGKSKGKFFKKKEKKKDPKDEKIADLTDKYQRLMAEFDNFRKRTEKEKTAMFEVGAKSVVEKMLPIVDSFERGLGAVPEENKQDPFVDGMDKVYKQMMTGLEEAGVKPIEAVGGEFNPDLHNAVMHVEDDELGENVVAEEFQKGYMYRESVVRHSMVKVAN